MRPPDPATESPPLELARSFLPPMRAVLADGGGQGWVELKYDGYRALAAIQGGQAALVSRNGLDFTQRFPAIVRALEGLGAASTIIDGEICVLDPDGVPRFELLQRGDGEDVVFFAFDLLQQDSADLRGLPLEERWDRLARVIGEGSSALRLAERLDGPPEDALSEAERRGFEGIVIKRHGSPYRARHPGAWRKRKAVAAQELAIVGFERTSTGGDAIGSLLLAVAMDDRFRYAGKVGTGFTAADREALFRRLSESVVRRSPVVDPPRLRGAVWVRPELVAEVRFTEWTSEGRLRQPSFKGLRVDKSPADCVREAAAPPEPSPGRAIPKARSDAGVRFTHPDRILFPRDGITKADVAAYYQAMAGPLLRALSGRPVALEHWNEGIDEPGWFHQKISDDDARSWMTLAAIPSQSGRRLERRLLVDDRETLRWLAQRSVLTVHMWSSRTDSLNEPDWAIFDLDPAEGEDIRQAVDVAGALKALLDALGLPSLAKTSGKRGLHVLVPMAPGQRHDEAVRFALTVGRAVEQVLPQVTLERMKDRRGGRLYIDCYQNGYGKTIAAPYSLRASDGAPVSAPLRWDEVNEGLEPGAFNLRTMPGRLDEVGDLFGPILEKGIRLPSL
ncbi:DNA ligase D [Vulgatibacter incomptus]|uniref:DNA ligase (ATP) n=1 Tax=Vulgatibacter incomptus TaxID=1391653 RepID=A0A0K1PA21_9BACT|nr:DNA ligase D [Vulgatibacter incomptus]AKU90261.1 ATP-dependent DNA ligase [Vulgatibacter incomptus]